MKLDFKQSLKDHFYSAATPVAALASGTLVGLASLFLIPALPVVAGGAALTATLYTANKMGSKVKNFKAGTAMASPFLALMGVFALSAALSNESAVTEYQPTTPSEPSVENYNPPTTLHSA